MQFLIKKPILANLSRNQNENVVKSIIFIFTRNALIINLKIASFVKLLKFEQSFLIFIELL